MNINLFLKAQEADNCKIKVKQFSIWKGILSVFKIAFPYSILGGGGGTVSLNGRRDQRNNLLPQAFLLGTDPFMICDSWPNCPWKAPPLNIFALGTKFQHEFWRRCTHSSHSIPSLASKINALLTNEIHPFHPNSLQSLNFFQYQL